MTETDLDLWKFKPYTRQTVKQAPQWSLLPPEQREAVDIVARVLPFRVKPYVLGELIDWDAVPDDPIYRLTFPHRSMLRARNTRPARPDRAGAAGSRDRGRRAPHPPADEPASRRADDRQRAEARRVPLRGIQHKYARDSAVLSQCRQSCHAYCTFCFRWPQFVGMDELKFDARACDELVAYLRRNRHVTDVLITGGDPLVMNALARWRATSSHCSRPISSTCATSESAPSRSPTGRSASSPTQMRTTSCACSSGWSPRAATSRSWALQPPPRAPASDRRGRFAPHPGHCGHPPDSGAADPTRERTRRTGPTSGRGPCSSARCPTTCSSSATRGPSEYFPPAAGARLRDLPGRVPLRRRPCPDRAWPLDERPPEGGDRRHRRSARREGSSLCNCCRGPQPRPRAATVLRPVRSNRDLARRPRAGLRGEPVPLRAGGARPGAIRADPGGPASRPHPRTAALSRGIDRCIRSRSPSSAPVAQPDRAGTHSRTCGPPAAGDTAADRAVRPRRLRPGRPPRRAAGSPPDQHAASQITMFAPRSVAEMVPRSSSGAGAGYRRVGDRFLRAGTAGRPIGESDHLPRSLLGEYLSFVYRRIVERASCRRRSRSSTAVSGSST